MRVLKFESREEWLNWRQGNVTGSTLYETITLKDGSETVKDAVYLKAAQSICGSSLIEDEASNELPMNRGSRLEKDAVDRFNKETGKKMVWSEGYKVGWQSDEDKRMTYSPDATGGVTTALEVKCLSALNHCKALFTKKIPEAKYRYQAIQGFIVNPKLRTLYFVFYDDRWPTNLQCFYLTLTRTELAEEIASTLAAEKKAMGKIREIVNTLTMYSPEEIKKVAEVKEELMKEAVEDHRSALDRVHAGIKERS